MPEFIDDLLHQIEEKSEQLRLNLTRGRVTKLDTRFKELFEKSWMPIKPEAHEEGGEDVIAVDGSRALRSYASGASLYITRALALRGKERYREIEIGSFLSRGKASRIEAFVNTKMEWLEFKVAAKAVERANFTGCLLLDGSIFGRMMHVPTDSPAEGMRGFMIDYFETFGKLLDLCKERKVLLLGVSKDSKASFLRDYLLSTMFNNLIADIAIKIDEEDQRTLVKAFNTARKDPAEAFNLFSPLKKKYGSLMEDVEAILKEPAAARPDHQIIRNFIEERQAPGYTAPLELSALLLRRTMLKRILSNPETFVKSQFKRAIAESERPEEFKKRAVDAVSKIPEYPAVISFSVLFDFRDTPIRVDVPAWTFGFNHRLKDVSNHERAFVNLDRIFSLLQAGYAGLRDYNIWLKRVDEEVRLRREIVDSLYSNALEKKLGVTVIHSRGYRRVKYP